ncbi:MAG: hypothetical protein GX972_05970, partial [Amphibacillus sp.]|nr:hypothetical protein [Amphibacillus sp.]
YQAVAEDGSYRSMQSMEKTIVIKEDIVQLDRATEQHLLTEDVIIDKAEAFINIFLQDIDQDYKVKGISTKEALIDRYQDIVSKQAVQPYIDYYFEEHDGGLYIVPTELPPWFISGNPYEVTQLDNGNVVIEQENEIDLYGRYRILIEFSQEDNWQIVRIEHLPAEDEQLDLI